MNKTPIHIKYYQYIDNSDAISVRVNQVAYSPNFDHELLTISNCKFEDNEPNRNKLILISNDYDNKYIDKLKSLNLVTENEFVYQSTDGNRNSSNYNYYTYINGSKVIIAIMEPNDFKLQLCFSDDPDDCYEFEDNKFIDCYRLFLFSDQSEQLNIVNKIHELSDRPHLNIDKEVMSRNEANRLLNQNIYNDLTDVRNKCRLGSELKLLT